MFGIGTPHRENNMRLQDKSDLAVSFGEVDSFVEPAPRDRQRQPLAARSDNPRKGSEFTPLLRTATKKNRMMNFETPGRANQTIDSIAENSGLTPVNWQRHQLPINKTTESLGTPSADSPMQAPNQHDIAGIREQEKAMDKMKKENWELKLKVFLMEKQIHQTSPEHVQLALKENIDYKIQVASLSRDVAKYKKSLVDTERKVADLGTQVSLSMSQECQLPHGMSEQDQVYMSKLEEERDVLRADLEDAEMKIRELEAEEAQVASLRHEIEELQGRAEHADQLVADLESARAELDATQNEKESLQEEVDSIRDDLVALQTKHDDLISQTRTAENDEVVDILRDQLDEKVDTIKDLTSTIRKLEGEKTTLESRTDSLTSRLQSVEERNDDLEGQIESLEVELQAGLASKDHLELAQYNYKLETDRLKLEIKEHERRVATQAHQIEQLEEEVRERQEDIEEFKGAAYDRSRDYRILEEQLENRNESLLQHNNATVSQLEEELSNTKLALRESAREVNTLKSRLTVLEHDNEQNAQTERARDQQIADLKLKVSEEQARSNTLERDTCHLRHKLESAVDRSNRLEQQLREIEESGDEPDATQIQDRLHDENAALRERIDDLETQLRDKEDEIDLAEEEASRLNTEIEELRTGSSDHESSLEHANLQIEQLRIQYDKAQAQQRTLTDKLIHIENARDRLQQDLSLAQKQLSDKDEKSQALNTSLLNVRSMLAETQTAHKDELQTIKKHHETECKDLKGQLSDVQANLQHELSRKQQALDLALKNTKDLERRLETCQKQVTDMEHTIQRLGENEQTANVDHARFKETLSVEHDRFMAREEDLKDQIKTLNSTIQQLRSDLVDRSTQIQDIEEELRHTKASESTAVLDNELMHARNAELDRNLSQVKQQIERLQLERATLSERVNVAESSCSSLQETLSQARRDQQQQMLAKADELFTKEQEGCELQDKLMQIENKCALLEAEKKRLAVSIASANTRILDSAERVDALVLEKEALELRLEQFQGQEEHTNVIESEQTRLRKELANTKTMLQDLQVELKDVETDREFIQTRLDELTELHKTKIEQHSAAMQLLRKEVQESHSTLASEAEKHSSTERKLSQESADLLARSSAEQRKLNEQVSNLEESLILAKQKHTDLLSNIGQTNTEVNKLQERLREKEITISELRHNIRANDSQRAEQTDSNGVLIELELEMDRVNEELRLATAKHEEERLELEADSDRAKSDLRGLQKKFDALTEEQRHLQHELAEQKRTVRTLRNSAPSRDDVRRSHASREQEDLQRQLEKAKKEIDSLRATAKSLELSKHHDKHAESRLTSDLHDATRKIKVLQADINAREKRINELKAYAKEKSGLLDALERRYKQLQSQIQNNAHLNPSQRHAEEVAGLGKMLKYLRSRTSREESFRADLTYIKRYYDKQITSFEACNQANLAIIRQIGIFPDPTTRNRPKMKSIASLVLATIKMRKAARIWATERKDREGLEKALRGR